MEKVIKRRLGYREDFDENNRIVKQEYITYGNKEYLISTVDLGLDHSFGTGEPLYYETMIFEKVNDHIDFADLYCSRYFTKEQALECHEKIIKSFNDNEVEFIDGYFQFK